MREKLFISAVQVRDNDKNQTESCFELTVKQIRMFEDQNEIHTIVQGPK